jgi:hypothetical protein
MKRVWEKPLLEVLDLSMTMAGAGKRTFDDYQDDPDFDEADKYS